MGFLNCGIYLAVMGVVCLFTGRLLPGKLLNPENWYFRCYAFERGGKIYEKLGIKKWQSHVPDMSRVVPWLMPPKNLKGEFKDRIPTMVRETCNAELNHWITSLVGLGCLWIWPGIGGVIVTLVDILVLNLPFILIQRYNRPRLMRLLKKQRQITNS